MFFMKMKKPETILLLICVFIFCPGVTKVVIGHHQLQMTFEGTEMQCIVKKLFILKVIWWIVYDEFFATCQGEERSLREE